MTNLRSFFQNIGLNTLARTLGDSTNSLLGWPLEVWNNEWPTLSETEVPDIALAEGRTYVKRHREMNMLEWICYVKLENAADDFVPR